MEATSRHATLIVNPYARGVGRTHIDADRIRRYLDRNGCETTLVIPGSSQDVTDAARAAVQRGDDLCFVLGGDGTQRDAAEGLEGGNTALAALPGGTVNVWAKEMGLPPTIRGAVDQHLGGQVTPADLGTANGRRFMLMASVGWDANAAHHVSPWLKKKTGDLAYIASFARTLPTARLQEIHWRTGITAGVHRVAVLVVSNTRVYGGRVNFAPDACANDGLLDITALSPSTYRGVTRIGFNVVRNKIATDRAVIASRAPEIVIETPGLPYQTDGDYMGETPVTFGVEAGVLPVSVPAGPLPEVLIPAEDRF